VVAGVCGRQSCNANFGFLSCVPWSVYPNWISSTEYSDANYTAVSSGLGSDPTSGYLFDKFQPDLISSNKQERKIMARNFSLVRENSLV
jgi:hypothetical protein